MNVIERRRRGCSRRRVPKLGVAILVLAAALNLTGCRAPDGYTAPAARTTPPHQQRVPVPPSADEVTPSSPRAVLDGTSTTQPATQLAPAPPR